MGDDFEMVGLIPLYGLCRQTERQTDGETDRQRQINRLRDGQG